MARQPELAVGLTAVIVAVTHEIPRVLVVRRMTHELATPAQKGLPVDLDSPDALPFGPFQAEGDRTLEAGLRSWVQEQTGLPLSYVEQLYTFADRYRDTRELAGGPRLVSVGYIALVREAPLSGTGQAEWRDWYGYFPWEDWRKGRPRLIDRTIRPALEAWADAALEDGDRTRRRQRVSMTFGADTAGWDFERTLERFELLYEAGLVVEALRDRLAQRARGTEGDGFGPAALETARLLGAPMALDNRRILATALGRLRGKIRYRPVVFELLPPQFTLLMLQRAVEALAGVRLHKQNFRRLVITGRLVERTGRREEGGRGRPAELFRFRREALLERTAPGVGIPTQRLTG
jgi:hypothetical protein